ncbi:uncharacterized protein ACJ7VT_020766 [Polymixia lowei]
MATKTTCPKLCQIIRDLCHSLECCQLLPGLLISSPAVLGTLQIMTGVVNIGLGTGRTSTQPGDLTSLGAAYWLGGVYITAGIMCVLAGRFPSPCLVGFTVFMNLAGVIFAVTGIVLYAIDLSDTSLYWMCDSRRYFVEDYDYDSGGYGDQAAQMAMRERHKRDFNDNCKTVAFLAERLLTAMDILLVILAVLQLCVNISAAVLGIKALISPIKREKGSQGAEPVLKQVLINPAA